MAGLPERLLDRRPQMRGGGEAGVVAKQPQRAPPIPGLAEFLDRRLQRRGDRLVLQVAVRDERIIESHGAIPVPSTRNPLSSNMRPGRPSNSSRLVNPNSVICQLLFADLGIDRLSVGDVLVPSRGVAIDAFHQPARVVGECVVRLDSDRLVAIVQGFRSSRRRVRWRGSGWSRNSRSSAQWRGPR